MIDDEAPLPAASSHFFKHLGQFALAHGIAQLSFGKCLQSRDLGPGKQVIVQYLSRLGYMRDFGTGIPRGIRLMREHNGTEPEFELLGEELVARLRGSG